MKNETESFLFAFDIISHYDMFVDIPISVRNMIYVLAVVKHRDTTKKGSSADQGCLKRPEFRTYMVNPNRR